MRTTYDEKADRLQLHVARGRRSKTLKLSPDIRLIVDASRRLLSIDVRNASTILDVGAVTPAKPKKRKRQASKAKSRSR